MTTPPATSRRPPALVRALGSLLVTGLDAVLLALALGGPAALLHHPRALTLLVGWALGGIALALLQPVENETFNITAGQARTLADLHGILRARFPEMPVEVVEQPTDFRPKRGTLDIAKARELLGYEPRYSLEDGVDAYVEFVTSRSAPGAAIAS